MNETFYGTGIGFDCSFAIDKVSPSVLPFFLWPLPMVL